MWIHLRKDGYNVHFMSSEIEKLLETANAANESVNSVNSAKRVFSDESQARSFFRDVCQRLLDTADWSENSSGSSYGLFDETGRSADNRPISEGDFIRISIHGSGKYDWVRVIRIFQTDREMVVTVHPTFDPTAQPPDTNTVSHFFHAAARNNFCVQLDGQTINFYVIGLNERQNVSDTGGLLETARNAATANLGYYLGIQKVIWSEFCKNFLRTEKEKSENDD